MTQYGWAEAPASVRDQVEGLAAGFEGLLADELLGVYLHGSLALGCWNPSRSDVDVLAVVRAPLAASERREAARLALAHSALREDAPPHPLELHVLTGAGLHPWRHPAPFDLHYGESRREAFERGELGEGEMTDQDLAAHVSIARRAAIAVSGPPAADVFPQVPSADFADALLGDLAWCRTVRRLDYAVLSPSRIWATLSHGGLQSKDTGARWALERAPERFGRLIREALALYRGETAEAALDEREVRAYVTYVEDRVRELPA